jgi:hypothetical protein
MYLYSDKLCINQISNFQIGSVSEIEFNDTTWHFSSWSNGNGLANVRVKAYLPPDGSYIQSRIDTGTINGITWLISYIVSFLMLLGYSAYMFKKQPESFVVYRLFCLVVWVCSLSIGCIVDNSTFVSKQLDCPICSVRVKHSYRFESH